MMTQFKNSFFQTSFLTTVWVMVLITLSNFHTTVRFDYLWNIIAIGVLAGITFGIIYPYIWNYSTTKAPVNIVICTIVNVSMQFLAIYLFSKEMLSVIQPYMIGIAVLTLIGHLIAFYFYKRILNKRMADELNQLKIH